MHKTSSKLVDMVDRDQGGITKRIYDHSPASGPFHMYRHMSGVSTTDDFVGLVLYRRNMCSALVSGNKIVRLSSQQSR